MSAVYKANSAGFRDCAVGPELTAAVLLIAEKAKAEAIALSEDFRKTGDYIESFRAYGTVTSLKTSFGEHDVATGVLENFSGHAVPVEWGNTHDHKPHRVLGRVLTTLGRD
jgi:hypothetical protein